MVQRECTEFYKCPVDLVGSRGQGVAVRAIGGDLSVGVGDGICHIWLVQSSQGF
jgi:hypothetical protein